MSRLNLWGLPRNFRHPIPSFHFNILDDVRFKLTVFRNELFDLASTVPFLASQPCITVWHQCSATPANAYDPTDFPEYSSQLEWFQNTPNRVADDFLPDLVEARFPPWLIPKFSSRPLARVSTYMIKETPGREREILDSLGMHSCTLKGLEIEREGISECMPLAEFVDYLALKVPLLESLGLWNVDAASRVSHFPS